MKMDKKELEVAIKILEQGVVYLAYAKPNAVDTLMKFEDVRKQLRIWLKNMNIGE